MGSACGDRSPLLQQHTLFDLDNLCADVITEDEATAHLSGTSTSVATAGVSISESTYGSLTACDTSDTINGFSPSLYPEYAAACGSPKQLGFGARPALLLVDVCKAYVSEASPLHLPGAKKAADNILELIKAARSHRPPISIVYSQTRYSKPTLQDAGLAAQKSPLSTSLFLESDERALWKAPAGLDADASADLILFKRYPSPFFGTSLAGQLTALGIDTLIIAGFTTSGSIRAAVLDAMSSGFRPMVRSRSDSGEETRSLTASQVVGGACTDENSKVACANLFDINAKYGDVVTAEDAKYHMK